MHMSKSYHSLDIFFFNDTATTEIYTLSLHDALPILAGFTTVVGGQPIEVEDSATVALRFDSGALGTITSGYYLDRGYHQRSEEHTSESSHANISYAVFCLKKKNNNKNRYLVSIINTY